jgi:hypothetical protein
MALSGKSDLVALELRIRALEAAQREATDIQSRQSTRARWTRGFVPQVQGMRLIRSEAGLSLDWDAATIPDLRYYELQFARKPNFGSVETVQTTDPFHFFTAGYGMPGFYFYVRARIVSDERRPGPWSPKLETAPPETRRTNPSGGVLALPRRPDAIVVGGVGAQTITEISGGWVGRCVTLFFLVAHTVQDSSRIRLVGNFTAGVNSSLTLRYMGAPFEWVEVARTGTI